MFRVLLPLVAIACALVPGSRAADPPNPAIIELFNGKDLKGWKLKDEKKSKWRACVVTWDEKKPGELLAGTSDATDGKGNVLANVSGGGCDIYTEEKFGNVVIDLEFMVPKGSNSGVYVMGEYEVQILDSYGKPDDKLTQGDLGALYSAAAPKKNVAKKPGEWQRLVILFEAPKFDADGKKTKNAKFLEVKLNGEVLHKDVEMKQHTPGGLTGKEAATGPLMFQGDHGPVAFRKIRIARLEIK